MSRIACLAVLCASLSGPAAAPPPEVSHLEWAKKAQGRWAYGMYITGKKVGWSVTQIKLTTRDGKAVMRTSTEWYISTLYDGQKSVRHKRLDVDYELSGVGAILAADMKQKEDGRESRFTAVRAGDKLKITQKGKRTITRTVDLPRNTLSEQRRLQAWLLGGPKVKERHTHYGVAWDEADLNEAEVYTLLRKKTVQHQGKTVAAYDVEVEVHGSRMRAELLTDGLLLNAVMGGLMTYRMEKEELAKKLGAPLDLMGAASVVLDRELGVPHNVDALTLEVSGLGDFLVPPSHRQKVRLGTGEGVRLIELKRDFRMDVAVPLSKAERLRYTRTTPRFQCNDPAVKRLARRVVDGETDAHLAATLLAQWVYKELRKSYSDNADTALEIIDSMAGDCTEHTLLFVALARAAGIPAREISGLAYVRGARPYLGWHAWAEFHNGHQWVSVDPTWNQVYVDGTHLKLGEGSRDLGWSNVAGKLKVRVVSVKQRK